MNQKELSDFESSGVECPSCDRTFDSRVGLGRHHSLTHGKKLTELEKETGEYDCPKCARSFDQKQGMKSHHAQVHGESIKGIELSCAWCGKSERRLPSNIVGDNIFCSDNCQGKFRSENYSGEGHPKWDGGGVTVRCELCGDEKTVSKHRKGKTDKAFCNLKCKAQWQSQNLYGSDHPAWRGGSGAYHAIRNNLGDKSWQSIAQSVRENYGNECTNCGKAKSDSDRALAVHHIVPVSCGGVNKSELLMPLCQGCHNKAESYIHKYPEFEPVLVE